MSRLFIFNYFAQKLARNDCIALISSMLEAEGNEPINPEDLKHEEGRTLDEKLHKMLYQTCHTEPPQIERKPKISRSVIDLGVTSASFRAGVMVVYALAPESVALLAMSACCIIFSSLCLINLAIKANMPDKLIDYGVISDEVCRVLTPVIEAIKHCRPLTILRLLHYKCRQSTSIAKPRIIRHDWYSICSILVP